MIERATKTLITPVTNTEVVVKEWITGREYEASQKPILESYKVGKESDLTGVVMQELNHKALEVYIISVGGNAENVIESLLDLPNDDYQFVVDTINEMNKKK